MKNLSVINVEFYTGVDQRLDVPIMLPPTPAAVDLSGMRVLIADDVADTGGTLELVHEFCADHVAEARTAVDLREAAVGDQGRLRLATDRPLDRLPLVGAAAGRRRRRRVQLAQVGGEAAR